MSVGEYCHRDVVTACPDQTARDAANLMRQRGVGCVVITEAKDTPVGIVTDRDLVQRVLRRQRDPETTLLRDVMNDEIVTVGVQMPLSRALARMRQEAVRRVLVVEGGGKLFGILTQDDILPIVSKELTLASEVIARQLRADPAPAVVGGGS